MKTTFAKTISDVLKGHLPLSLIQLEKSNSLSAAERIKSRKLFERLSAEGQVVKSHPFRMIWCPIPFRSSHPIQVAVTVSKRNMAEATARNRTKRIMREAYRLNKHALISWAQEQGKGFAILFIAQVQTPPDFHLTQEKIILLLHRLMMQNAEAD